MLRLVFMSFGMLIGVHLCCCNLIWKKYYKVDSNLLTTFHDTSKKGSVVACLESCDNNNVCKSISYKATTQECRLSSISLKDVDLSSDVRSEWVTYSNNDPLDWIVMFQGIPNIGIDVYESWVNGHDATSSDIKCMGDAVQGCTKHFRNRLVDGMFKIGVKEVRFSLYKDGTERGYITFDGVGADLESWFSQTKVLDSRWKDLDHLNVQFFSLAGHAPTRRFLIVNPYIGCPHDRLVTMALISDAIGCSYELHNYYPKFLYSTSDGWGDPTTPNGTEFADLIRISIRM